MRRLIQSCGWRSTRSSQASGSIAGSHSSRPWHWPSRRKGTRGGGGVREGGRARRELRELLQARLLRVVMLRMHDHHLRPVADAGGLER